MKVILLQDVKSLGKKGDIVNVSEGYARNMILPKKLGVEANNKNLNDLKLQNQHADKVAQENLEAAQAMAKKISEWLVETKIKTGEGGRTFGSVSSKEICAAVKTQYNETIDKKKIHLEEPIRSQGTFEVKVKLHPQVTATMRVHVSGEQKLGVLYGRGTYQTNNAKQLRGGAIRGGFYDYGQRCHYSGIGDFNPRGFLSSAVWGIV